MIFGSLLQQRPSLNVSLAALRNSPALAVDPLRPRLGGDFMVGMRTDRAKYEDQAQGVPRVERLRIEHV